MFEAIERIPGDAILGLIEQFRNDPNPSKVDLGVGVYRNEDGHTPILESVKAAERQLLEDETTKAYIGSHGNPQYGDFILRQVLGTHSPLLDPQRARVTQAPGGTGALRLAADLLVNQLPGRDIWVPSPTWGNHITIFEGAGLTTRSYPYVNGANEFDFPAMLEQLKAIPQGDILLLHACCHNPSGFDPNRQQWQQILEVIQQRQLLPLVDFAYQGFGDGLEEDAYSVRLLAENLNEMLIAHSCSKSFGIYRERTGSLIVVAGDETNALDVHSQVAGMARANYSNPPAHGSAIVSTIAGSEQLENQWRDEVANMRQRIAGLRQRLIKGLQAQGLGNRFDFIAEQRGMFSYTGLKPAQVDYLRDRYSIYMVGSGRANIAGLNDDNIEYVCQAIAQALQH